MDDSNSTSILQEFQERIVELEEAFRTEKELITREWENERLELVSSLENCRAEYESLRQQSIRTIESMRSRYDQSLKDAQDGLDDQMSASRAEIERLQERIKSLEVGTNSQAGEAEAAHERVGALQTTLTETTKEVEKYRSKLVDRERQHGEELRNVWTQFERYRLSQEHIISSLQNEISLLSESAGGTPHGDSKHTEQHKSTKMELEYKRLTKAQVQFYYRVLKLCLQAV